MDQYPPTPLSKSNSNNRNSTLLCIALFLPSSAQHSRLVFKFSHPDHKPTKHCRPHSKAHPCFIGAISKRCYSFILEEKKVLTPVLISLISTWPDGNIPSSQFTEHRRMTIAAHPHVVALSRLYESVVIPSFNFSST
jgi:hypothetical protein